MSTLIRSDIYRMRREATLRYTFLGAFGIVLLLWFIFFISGLTGEPTDAAAAIEAERAVGVGVVSTALAMGSGVDFARELIGQNITGFLLLPLFIGVFTQDFSSGTYRNLLSYETNRKKIYAAKLLLSFGLTMALVLFIAVSSAVVGGIAFGFGGMLTLQFLGRTLASLALMAPLYLALVSFGHMVTAIARKTSTTIAVYFVVLLVYSSLVQLVAMMLPGLEWITLIDFLSGISYLTYYWVLPGWEIVGYLALGFGVSLVCTLVGLRKYATVDMP